MVGSSNSVPETAIISVLRGQPSHQSDESRQRVLRRCVRRPIGVCLERKGFWLLVDVSIVWFINQLFTWKIIIIQHLVNLGTDGDAGHAIDCCRCMASLSLQLKVLNLQEHWNHLAPSGLGEWRKKWHQLLVLAVDSEKFATGYGSGVRIPYPKIRWFWMTWMVDP
jgi:hypothetical protein